MALNEQQLIGLNAAKTRQAQGTANKADLANLKFAKENFGFGVSNEEVISKVAEAKGSPPTSEAEIEAGRRVLLKRQVDKLSPAEQEQFLSLNPELSQAKQNIQDTANPSLFTGFLKAALAQKVKPEDQKIGRASIFGKRGLTGIASLSQALNTRSSQITDNIKNFTAFFQTADNVIRDQATAAINQYTILRNEQQDLIDRQRELEDADSQFNKQLTLLKKQEELRRETAKLSLEQTPLKLTEVQGGFATFNPATGELKRTGTNEVISKLNTTDFNGRQITAQQDVIDRLDVADTQMFAQTGQHIKITDSFRTSEQQAGLQNIEGRVAPVGQSFHQKGLAIDISNWQEAEPFLREQGIVNDLPDDKGHFSVGETNDFDVKPILPVDANEVDDNRELTSTELKAFGVPAGTTWGDIKNKKLVPGSITDAEASRTVDNINVGLDRILAKHESIPNRRKGSIQGRITSLLKRGERDPKIAAFEAERAIVGMMLTRLFEKGRISDQDRIFYMSQMPNLNQNNDAAKASATTLKKLLKERVIQSPLDTSDEDIINQLSPSQRAELESEGLL